MANNNGTFTGPLSFTLSYAIGLLAKSQGWWVKSIRLIELDLRLTDDDTIMVLCFCVQVTTHEPVEQALRYYNGWLNTVSINGAFVPNGTGCITLNDGQEFPF